MFSRFFFLQQKNKIQQSLFVSKLLEIIEYKICLKFLHLFIKSTKGKIQSS